MFDLTISDDVTVTCEERPLLAGRYRVVKQLGQGGMGSVWLAEDTKLDNLKVALKMLPSILISNKRAYAQVKAEALIALKLSHSNIVTVRAFEEDVFDAEGRRGRGSPFLVMDYIEGETLDDYLAEKGTLTEEETVKILTPIAAALDYAHAQGVVHRDVKPGNVMIRKDGTPFILDFGIAREIQETMTRVTGRMSSGTLMYMSPEQNNGDAPKAAQDVYSFAAMVYECLTGNPPFVRGNIEDQIKNKIPEPLSSDISIGAAVMAGLAKKPEERPVSCFAVLGARAASPADLAEVADKKGEESRAESQRCGDGKSAVKTKGAAVLLSGLAIVGALAVGGWWLHQNMVGSTGGKTPPMSPLGEETNTPPTVVTSAPQKSVTRADVDEIKVEAEVQMGKCRRIDDSDGFKAKKEECEDVFNRANAQWNLDKWAEAAKEFTNSVSKCQNVVALRGKRDKAKSAGEELAKAIRAAKDADAAKWAKTRFDSATEISKRGKGEFGRMEFDSAAATYGNAKKQFEQAATEAKAAKKVFDDAEAKKAAEEAEKRRQEEAERQRRANWRKEGEQFTIDTSTLNMTMKWCRAGSFTMGSPRSEQGRFDKETQHRVTLTKGFWMGETEVTQGQWKKLMEGETVIDLMRKVLQDDTPLTIGDKQMSIWDFYGIKRDTNPANLCGDINDNIPVYNVSWNDAVEFCRRLTQCERDAGRIPDGYEYRLPTEAEWEYACRAGTTTALPNGLNINIQGYYNAPNLDDIAWYGGNSSIGFIGKGWDTSSWPEKQHPGGLACAREVKGKQPNNWGLYDMIGNVWEWTLDCYGAYGSDDVTNPLIVTGEGHVARGGSWRNIAGLCRSANRDRLGLSYLDDPLGFRVALAPKIDNIVIGSSTVFNGHEGVQLWENGPYWATCNVGAENPWDSGYYFWWGDRVGYIRKNGQWVASDGSATGFSFDEDNTPTCNKNNGALQQGGWITGDGVLSLKHDAVHVHWGGGWRMPTKADIEALNNNTTTEWKMTNGVLGRFIHGKGAFAKESIFLPAVGYGQSTLLNYSCSCGNYWSSTPDSNFSNLSSGLLFGSGGNYDDKTGVDWDSVLGGSTLRFHGQSIRPVRDAAK